MFLCSISTNQEKRKSPDISDGLISQIALGDTEALRELYEKTSSVVYGFALSILKNQHDAQDVMQELYVKVYENAPQYVSRGKPMAWILTITRNLSLMKLRENGRFEQMDVNQGSEEAYYSDLGEHEALKGAMTLLTDVQRQAVMLHALSGFKHHECAALLKIPLSTELSHYHRAIKKLRAHLINEEESKHGQSICGTAAEKRC